MPRAERTGGEPDRRHYRQPEREKRRKRGAWIDPPGYDAGKKIKGKKRHLLVDTLGLLLHAVVHPAHIQDRDGGILLLATMFHISRGELGALPIPLVLAALAAFVAWGRAAKAPIAPR